jgi:nucleotide-binding universal stress UspA family protein
MALGTQGSNAISQAFLGSVARHVLRAAGCDLLVSP